MAEELVSFSSQMQKAIAQLKQTDSEMMENINVILATVPEIDLTAHAQACLDKLKGRRVQLFRLIHFLQDEINANKDAEAADVPIDRNYL